jgi:XTP/dITP diphosphohydrolase
MNLVIASNNKNKITEIKQILSGDFDAILSMAEAGMFDEIEETGKTFRENALIKAKYVAEKVGCAVLADDSGLEVDALGGAPGVYSARYCGYHGDDEANNDKLLGEMEHITDRKARFTCAAALVMPGGKEFVAEGHCPGEIIYERRGTGGFGYDPLFYMDYLEKTMAQLDDETKNRISHRYRALTALKELFESENG